MSISIPSNQMLYITDGLTKTDKNNNSYISYRPVSGIPELRHRLVMNEKGESQGYVLDVMDDRGSTVMTVGAEGGLYTGEAIVGKKVSELNVKA